MISNLDLIFARWESKLNSKENNPSLLSFYHVYSEEITGTIN
jgi:hypothetical protein